MNRYLLAFGLLGSILISACQQPGNPESGSDTYLQMTGPAQGATYEIKYSSNEEISYQPQVKAIFKAIDSSMSTYKKNSLISRFNAGDTIVMDDHFKKVLHRAMEIHEQSNGALEPTIMPLVRFWGFSQGKPKAIDSIDLQQLDSMKNLVDLKSLVILDESGERISEVPLMSGQKRMIRLAPGAPGMALDFNAIAQGYTVDVIGEFLESQGVKNYYVNVGGEVVVKGKNPHGKDWRVAIEDPDDGKAADDQSHSVLINMKSGGLATSGNYRKFYIKDGVKYSHTLDPETGYPVQDRLLSATILAKDAMTADAYATVMMVLGLDKAKAYLNAHPEMDGYLIYSGDNGEWLTYATDGLKKLLEESKE